MDNLNWIDEFRALYREIKNLQRQVAELKESLDDAMRDRCGCC